MNFESYERWRQAQATSREIENSLNGVTTPTNDHALPTPNCAGVSIKLLLWLRQAWLYRCESSWSPLRRHHANTASSKPPRIMATLCLSHFTVGVFLAGIRSSLRGAIKGLVFAGPIRCLTTASVTTTRATFTSSTLAFKCLGLCAHRCRGQGPYLRN